MAKWYDIKATGKRSAEIVIYEEIGGWGVSAKQFIEDLKAAGDLADIVLRLNSPGGSVFDGMAIYNQLKAHPAQVTVHIDGLAASMASVIAMAGDLIVMPDNAMMMIHNPWTVAIGDAEDLRKNADMLDKVKKAIQSAYMTRTGKSEQDISDMMDAETWLTGSEAVAMGFADETTEQMDIAASVKNFDLSGFEKSPFKSVSAVADKQQPQERVTMKPETVPATQSVENKDAIADAVQAALAGEKSRKDGIIASFGDFADQHVKLMTDCLADQTVTVEAAQKKLLLALGANEKPVSTSTVTVGPSGVERFIEDGVEALLARAGMGTTRSGNPMRHMKMEDMAAKALSMRGHTMIGSDPRAMVAAAFGQSTSDFPILLENTMYKVIQAFYAVQKDTWSGFCATGSVSDFRAHNRLRVGSLGNLDTLTELGEYKNKAIPDAEKSSVSIGVHGNIISLSREAIINDDLGQFVSVGRAMGRAAARTVEAKVYALLAENSGLGPTMSDGLTLFHASHGNIGTGAAISLDALQADILLMASQMDVSGNDYLDVEPSILLVPKALHFKAIETTGAEFNEEANKSSRRPNAIRSHFDNIIGSKRISGTRRYLFANPSEAPVIEVSFLNGMREPFIERENGWRTDGVEWKVRLDFGVNEIDYRGAVTNAGA